jgi:hypothetical protein
MASQYASLASPGVKRRSGLSRGSVVTRDGRSQTAVVEAITYTPPLWKKMKRFVLRGLTTKERLLLSLRYCERLTFTEIAVVLEMPESRVAELHRNVVQRVRKWVLDERKNRTQVA